MNPETQTTGSESLTRRQKLVRRVGAPLAVLAAGLTAGVVMERSQTNEVHDDEPRSETVHVQINQGIDDSDWGHTTAQNMIMYAVGKGSAEAIGNLSPGDTETTPDEIAQMVSKLSFYDQTTHALELASEDGSVLPQPGQELSMEVDVTVTESSDEDTEEDYAISYEVVDAEYQTPSDEV